MGRGWFTKPAALTAPCQSPKAAQVAATRLSKKVGSSLKEAETERS